MLLVILPNFWGYVLCNIIIFKREYEIWSIEYGAQEIKLSLEKYKDWFAWRLNLIDFFNS